MSVLTLNGVELPLEYGSPTRMRVYNGAHGVRSHSGQPRTVTRSRAFEYKANTVLSPAAEVEAYRALVEGDGHSLDFEITTGNPTGLATSRGMTPSDNTGAYSSDFINHVGYGRGVFAPNETRIAWSLQLPASGWTVLSWYLNGGAGAMNHHIVRSDGAKWLAGERADSTYTGYMTVDVTGAIALEGEGSDDVYVTDLVALPYLIPDDWAQALYAFHASRPFPALPLVVAEGRAVQNASGVVCLGQVGEFRQEDTGALLESFDFTLHGTP